MNKSCSIYTLVTLVESSNKNDYQAPFWKKKTIPKSDRRALYQGTNLFQQFRTNPLTAFCLRNPVHGKNDRMTDANHIVTHNEWSINRRRRTACLQQEIRGDTCTAPSLAITYRSRRREIGQRNAVHLPHGHLPPYPTLILNPNRHWIPTRSSATAYGPRDVLYQSKSCQLLHNCPNIRPKLYNKSRASRRIGLWQRRTCSKLPRRADRRKCGQQVDQPSTSFVDNTIDRRRRRFSQPISRLSTKSQLK